MRLAVDEARWSSQVGPLQVGAVMKSASTEQFDRWHQHQPASALGIWMLMAWVASGRRPVRIDTREGPLWHGGSDDGGMRKGVNRRRAESGQARVSTSRISHRKREGMGKERSTYQTAICT